MKILNTEEQEATAILNAVFNLSIKKFKWLGGWIFEKHGKRYDLSAADLTQTDRIEREGLFLVKS